MKLQVWIYVFYFPKNRVFTDSSWKSSEPFIKNLFDDTFAGSRSLLYCWIEVTPTINPWTKKTPLSIIMGHCPSPSLNVPKQLYPCRLELTKELSPFAGRTTTSHGRNAILMMKGIFILNIFVNFITWL